MKKDYVPGSNGAFRSWVISLYSFVSNNAVEWDLPVSVVPEFDSMLTEFLALFATVENKRTRTTEQVLTYESYKAEFTTFLRSLVQVHLVRNSQIPYATKIAMNLNPRVGSSERPDIDSEPIIVLTNAARGVIKIKLLVLDMGKRPKIHPNANGAELRFYISAVPTQVQAAKPEASTDSPQEPTPTPTPIPIPTPTPNTAASNKDVFVMDTFFTTRGSFDRKMENYLGKAFVVQGRWVNTTDAEKNGTWSDFFTIIIA
ncbi:MAG: hypothetical protein K9J17_16380 [Flavobacteriales bacterium]|nr:hypothetical protein [Flavobacteriales bacterium]